MHSSWRSVTGGVSQGSMLGPGLLNLLISDLDEGIECVLSKCIDNPKLGGVADAPECSAVIQKAVDRLQRWAGRNLL